MKRRTTILKARGAIRSRNQIPVKIVIAVVFLVTQATVCSEVLTVSLYHNNFAPTEKELTLTDIFPGTVVFSVSKPAEIYSEPVYKGTSQRYASVNLGNKRDRRFQIVLDYVDEASPVCYFDTNKNGNLADDGGPIETGLDYFSIFDINIPCSNVFEGVNWKGDLKIHLSASPANAARGIYTLSVSTVLLGKVFVDGSTYEAYIADSRQNDADFTNDGIVIDLNRNGSVDRKTELFSPNTPVHINGKVYDLEIRWGHEPQTVTAQTSSISSPSELHIPIVLRPLVYLFKIIFRY